jgi:hypothetical protein
MRDVPPTELRAVADFMVIGDRAGRSRALFAEAARVLMHPRCVNCHPDGDTPHQGMAAQIHDPPVVRGPEDRGVPGNECTTCHQDRNQELPRVPGAPSDIALHRPPADPPRGRHAHPGWGYSW